MPTTNPDQDLMNIEWHAWQRVVAEWRRRFPKDNINDDTNGPLIGAINAWAEYRAVLRMQQGRAYRQEEEMHYERRCETAGKKPLPMKAAGVA
jgi:hypothetical protein